MREAISLVSVASKPSAGARWLRPAIGRPVSAGNSNNTIVIILTELQKDYFCPVSGFSTEKCPNHVFGEMLSLYKA